MIDYSEYPLWQRELIFKEQHKDFPEPQFAILWEDPSDLDAPMKVTTPSPVFLAMAMHGGILPPIEAFLALKEDEAKPDFKQHTRGYLLHESEPVGPMTEEEVMEFLIMKDLPASVWRDYKGNRTILKIVPRHMVPSERTLRNAWHIKQDYEKEAA